MAVDYDFRIVDFSMAVAQRRLIEAVNRRRQEQGMRVFV